MYEIVLVERYLPESFFWENLLKRKQIKDLSLEEVLDKYQGFEGELIALFSIQNEVRFEEGIRKCFNLKGNNNFLIFHVILQTQANFSLLKQRVLFMGYDVGICEENKTIYSSIFNEVLFGLVKELVEYKNLLNQNLLFQHRSLAEEYLQLHNELSASKKDIEDYEKMNIYEVWKQTDIF